MKEFGDIGLEFGITEIIPSSLDTGNEEIEEDFSLRVLIIRLTASSNLSFALGEDFSTTDVSWRKLLVDSEADAVLDAADADAGFLGYR